MGDLLIFDGYWWGCLYNSIPRGNAGQSSSLSWVCLKQCCSFRVVTCTDTVMRVSLGSGQGDQLQLATYNWPSRVIAFPVTVVIPCPSWHCRLCTHGGAQKSFIIVTAATYRSYSSSNPPWAWVDIHSSIKTWRFGSEGASFLATSPLRVTSRHSTQP